MNPLTNFWTFTIALAVLSFNICYLLTPKLASWLKRRGIVGIDIHKESKPKIAEMGGIAILLSLTPPIFMLYFYTSNNSLLIWMLAYSLTSFLGIIDYFYTLKPVAKVLSLLAIGLFITVFLNFHGLFLVIFPVIFMIACNFTNMLAGFNGLEIGNGFIIFSFLTFLLLLEGHINFAAVSLIYAVTLLAFLLHNKYPAKVFPGDVATLPIGAALVTIVFICKIPLALLFLAPQAFDAFLKFISAGIVYRQKGKPTIVKNGILYPPKGEWLSLPRLLLYLKPTTEPKLVLEIWLIQIITCLIATLIII